MKKIHYYSGLFISIFITIHFINHLFALVSPEKHIETMEIARLIYRNIIFETLLIIAVVTQVIAGFKLVKNKRATATNGWDKLHIYSGLYLSFFLIVHPIAIFAGRYYFQLDTNFWFGATVVNYFPMVLFYGPYYFLGVFAFFTHVACIHRQRVIQLGWKTNPNLHAKVIMSVGAIVGLLILAGFTGYFQGLQIPVEYSAPFGL